MENMHNLVLVIKALQQKGAVHRKGFDINEATPSLAVANAVEELGELLVAYELQGRHSEQVQEEAADVLAVFVHLCMLLNFDLDRLEQCAIKKVLTRFKVPE